MNTSQCLEQGLVHMRTPRSIILANSSLVCGIWNVRKGTKISLAVDAFRPPVFIHWPERPLEFFLENEKSCKNTHERSMLPPPPDVSYFQGGGTGSARSPAPFLSRYLNAFEKTQGDRLV